MKRFLFVLMACVVGCPVGAFADDGSGFAMAQIQMQELKSQRQSGALCGESSVSFKGTQAPSDDEFLYTTVTAYNSARGRTDNATISGGLVYECDNDHCQHNHVVDMPAGHVFKGKRVDSARKYRCDVGVFIDNWVPLNEGCMYKGTFFNKSSYYTQNGNRAKLTRADCTQIRARYDAERSNEFWLYCDANGQLQCVSTGAPAPEEPPADPEPNPNPGSGSQPAPVRPTPTSSCVDRCKGMTGTRYAECTTCCLVPASYADWNGSECVCSDSTLDFNVLTQKCEPATVAQPVTPVQPVEPAYECDPEKIATLRQWQVRYGSDLEVAQRIRVILEYCEGEPMESVFITMFNELESWLMQRVQDLESAQELSQAQARARTRIADAVRDMRDIESGLKLTVWRDEDGNFNTSRLLSDSIAGVVLGTAGGLITSNVVKKNNIENGFEDIQCTVGGQVVAGWGDEFRVGIQ